MFCNRNPFSQFFLTPCSCLSFDPIIRVNCWLNRSETPLIQTSKNACIKFSGNLAVGFSVSLKYFMTCGTCFQ